jgi:universal stress protein A
MKTANLTTQTSKPAELVPFYLKLKKILVPIDFSPASLKALNYAIPFADQFGASITLLHVLENQPFPSYAPFEMEHTRLSEVSRDLSKEKLKKLYPKLVGASGIKVRTIVHEGKPYEVINKVAQEIHADVIIMATHGFTGLKHAVLGSTTERVVRFATRPVLTVRN